MPKRTYHLLFPCWPHTAERDGEAKEEVVDDYINRGEGSTYRCRCCPHSTPRRQDMVRHVARRHFTRCGYECPRCAEAFRAKDQMYGTGTSGRCTGSGYTARSRNVKQGEGRPKLKTAAAADIPARNHCSSTLLLSFAEASSVDDFIRKDDASGLFLCLSCPFSAKDRSGLKRHVESHHYSPGYACQFCHKPYNAKYLLLRHIRKYHRNHEEEEHQ